MKNNELMLVAQKIVKHNELDLLDWITVKICYEQMLDIYKSRKDDEETKTDFFKRFTRMQFEKMSISNELEFDVLIYLEEKEED